MKERPILFSGAMVRAILEGRKTVTRRAIKPVWPSSVVDVLPFAGDPSAWMPSRPGAPEQPWEEQIRVCPYGQPGDRLWVREAHSIHRTHGQRRDDGERWGPWGGLPTRISPDGTQISYYREGFDRCDPGRWRPSIHMPRWVSRILLEITAIRVERLQDITEEQAVAEGVDRPENIRDVDVWDGAERELFNAMNHPRDRFKRLWADINGAESWDANPWVWVVEFKPVEPDNV